MADMVAKQNGDQNVNTVNIPICFFQESSLFGRGKPSFDKYLKHEEMYRALSDRIDASHLTGLQRVNGMWRIYTDNLADIVTLITSVVTLRGRTLPITHTNPYRLDSENITRVRIQNIPLSASDDLIKRSLVLSEIEIVSIFREKLRFNGKLTNCETGDRLLNVKTKSLREPLPRFMQFGQFKAKVIHRGQVNTSLKCTKCLDTGHSIASCTNEWKCIDCHEFGHKRGQCSKIETDDESDAKSDASDLSQDASGTSDDEEEAHKSDASQPGGSPQENQKTPDVTPATGTVLQDKLPPKTSHDGRKKAKASKGRKKSRLSQFMTGATGGETPNKDRTRSVTRSPPTPAETLNDRSKKPREKDGS